MTMRAEIVDSKLQIDVVDLFEHLDSDTLMSIADHVAITDQVIEFVTQQILDGWTEMDSHGGKLANASPSPCTGLDKAVREVAKRSSEVAKIEIERLETALKMERNEVGRLRMVLAKDSDDNESSGVW